MSSSDATVAAVADASLPESNSMPTLELEVSLAAVPSGPAVLAEPAEPTVADISGVIDAIASDLSGATFADLLKVVPRIAGSVKNLIASAEKKRELIVNAVLVLVRRYAIEIDVDEARGLILAAIPDTYEVIGEAVSDVSAAIETLAASPVSVGAVVEAAQAIAPSVKAAVPVVTALATGCIGLFSKACRKSQVQA
jgi:hypothetical protein